MVRHTMRLSLAFLSFLGSPWFAVPWFSIAIAAAVWIAYDTYTVNTPLNPPLKVGWIILTLFFSILGLILYLLLSRPPGIGDLPEEQKQHRFEEYATPMFRKVTGSVMHCVAGDGLGIMTAMALSRIWDLEFWPEFWLEYIVGFLFGWLFFQLWAMRRMGHPWGTAVWHAGRAEFFSMITVMIGMGLVMYSVTPNAIGHRPDPWEWSFWSFGALGLLAGALFTYPMNGWLVHKGWKHGMG